MYVCVCEHCTQKNITLHTETALARKPGEPGCVFSPRSVCFARRRRGEPLVLFMSARDRRRWMPNKLYATGRGQTTGIAGVVKYSRYYPHMGRWASGMVCDVNEQANMRSPPTEWNNAPRIGYRRAALRPPPTGAATNQLSGVRRIARVTSPAGCCQLALIESIYPSLWAIDTRARVLVIKCQMNLLAPNLIADASVRDMREQHVKIHLTTINL